MIPVGRILAPLGRLRPRWAWVLLALGLLSLLLPPGCLRILGITGLATAIVRLGAKAMAWLWRRLLFKVSRRLWVILLLSSLLPAATLALGFLSLAWLLLGAQVTRSIQGHLHRAETVLRQVDPQATDARVLSALQAVGQAHILRSPRPAWMHKPFTGLAYDRSKGLVDLRRLDPSGRLLVLDLDRLAQEGRALWGGRLHFRLDPSQRAAGDDGDDLALDQPLSENGRPAMAAWIQGDLEPGQWFMRPFRLPSLGVRVVDWETGAPLVLTLRPETSLREIFQGYGFDQGNRSLQTFVSIALLATLLSFLALLALVALLMGLHLARNLGRSVDGLFRGVARLSGGDFSVRIRPRGHDQVGQLTRDFNDMARRLEEASREREERGRLEEELRVAREVQMRLLPDLAGFQGAAEATILPAKEVAGDWFDLLRLSDGRLAFLIADVSGKGTSAAFYAAETKGILAALDKEALDPVAVASRINAIWCATHPRARFMTLAYGIFDPATGAFAFVRAGHPAAFLRRADGTVERLEPRGLGIGLSATRFEALTEACEGRLEPGDALVLFTDGLSEALDPGGDLFGEVRLAEALVGAPEPRTALLEAVAAFTAGRPLEDDLTLLVLRR